MFGYSDYMNNYTKEKKRYYTSYKNTEKSFSVTIFTTIDVLAWRVDESNSKIKFSLCEKVYYSFGKSRDSQTIQLNTLRLLFCDRKNFW